MGYLNKTQHVALGSYTGLERTTSTSLCQPLLGGVCASGSASTWLPRLLNQGHPCVENSCRAGDGVKRQLLIERTGTASRLGKRLTSQRSNFTCDCVSSSPLTSLPAASERILAGPQSNRIPAFSMTCHVSVGKSLLYMPQFPPSVGSMNSQWDKLSITHSHWPFRNAWGLSLKALKAPYTTQPSLPQWSNR